MTAWYVHYNITTGRIPAMHDAVSIVTLTSVLATATRWWLPSTFISSSLGGNIKVGPSEGDFSHGHFGYDAHPARRLTCADSRSAGICQHCWVCVGDKCGCGAEYSDILSTMRWATARALPADGLFQSVSAVIDAQHALAATVTILTNTIRTSQTHMQLLVGFNTSTEPKLSNFHKLSGVSTMIRYLL